MISLVTGVGLLSVSAALILAGSISLFFAWLIERAKQQAEKQKIKQKVREISNYGT